MIRDSTYCIGLPHYGDITRSLFVTHFIDKVLIFAAQNKPEEDNPCAIIKSQEPPDSQYFKVLKSLVTISTNCHTFLIEKFMLFSMLDHNDQV
jgi:hypothetical protein